VSSAYANAFEFGPRDFDAGEILPPLSNFPQSDLGRWADSRWALPQISSLNLQKLCEWIWPWPWTFKGGDIALNGKLISELQRITCHMGSHTHSVTCHPKQVNAPHLNPSQIGWYSIYLPWRDGRLSWPRWLITYQDGLPACRQLPITVLRLLTILTVFYWDTFYRYLANTAARDQLCPLASSSECK